jgi:ubiquinone/menaquinone biosynthesis C-methylase UbiE
LTDPTAQARDRWAAVAAAWERNADLVARSTAPVIRWLVDHLDPQPGQTVVELAAGPGDTGFAVARRLGPDGRLVSTDIVGEMVDAARRRATMLGVSNVDFAVIDAQRIDLDDDSADGIVHRFGPMLLPDPASAFAEARRVLRDHGRYVCAVWTGPEANPWVSIGTAALARHGIEVPEIDPFAPGGMFSFADPERLATALREAGFAEVVTEAVESKWSYADFDELWRHPSEISGRTSTVLRGLDADTVATVKRTFEELTEPYHTTDGYRIPARALCALAR